MMPDRAARFHAAEQPISRAPSRSASATRDLFLPLEHLLGCGGDPRLSIDPASGLNQYGCRPLPCPDTLSFASSTATSISGRAYARASDARESLMRSAIAVGIDEALDSRIEAMRGELKDHLGLSRANVDVVFSPSGTDSELQALFLTRAVLGPVLTTIIVAADQTGSGTGDTARGRHFSTATASGSRVRKGDPVAGLADSVTSVALPLFDAAGHCRPQADSDSLVLGAVEKSVANGSGVLLQIMDSSKLGWRAPSEQCLDEIRLRWPHRVQVVVDACQMRLGRPRLRKYLERGYIVIVTGSKFFTGPPFSGALLVPAGFSNALDAVARIAPGFREYSSRGDWPKNWPALRSRFPVRANLGQWLRWEAALEEIRAYYSVPDQFRRLALTTFGQGVKHIIASSRSLNLLPSQHKPEYSGADDEELAQPTIFPLVIRYQDGALSLTIAGRSIARSPGTDETPSPLTSPAASSRSPRRFALSANPSHWADPRGIPSRRCASAQAHVWSPRRGRRTRMRRTRICSVNWTASARSSQRSIGCWRIGAIRREWSLPGRPILAWSMNCGASH